MTRTRILLITARVTVFLAVVAALVVLTSKVSSLSGRIQTQQDQLSQDIAGQTHNRATNVARWCHAINHDRRVLVSYVAAFAAQSTAVPRLNLPQLPCARLEQATVASTHPGSRR